MRTIVHISDLHFGRVDPNALDPLREAVRGLSPDLVAVSGDLTQRARPGQFRQAREFLDTLPSPRIVVPGNHDVPLYDVVSRFLRPMARFRKFVTDDLTPYFEDAEIAVAGLNTARSWTFQGGRLNIGQIEGLRARICALPASMVKIVVTHHPFDLPPGGDERHLVGRAAMAMETFARCGADLLLSGHLHVSRADATAARYRIEGYSALVVTAGTATSTRGRGEANSFNVVRIERPAVAVERWERAGEGAFRPVSLELFRHEAAGWLRRTVEGISADAGSPPATPR